MRIRRLSAGELDRLETVLIRDRRAAEFRAWLVRLGTVDDAGASLFTDNDVMALGEKSGLVMSRIASRIAALSGLTGETAFGSSMEVAAMLGLPLRGGEP